MSRRKRFRSEVNVSLRDSERFRRFGRAFCDPALLFLFPSRHYSLQDSGRTCKAMAAPRVVAAEATWRSPVTHSILNGRPPPADATGVHGDCPSRDHQQCSSSAASHRQEPVQDAGEAKEMSKVQPRWIPCLLALLFVACLLFAAWVWYQIFHILN